MKDASRDRQLPGDGLDIATMPAPWMLARIGKRVLRPGGRKLTRVLLRDLRITPDDQVVELAPGLGVTTQLVLDTEPREYTRVERDQDAADIVGRLLTKSKHTCQVGTAQDTGLADNTATVVVGEAFLSMQSDPAKAKIVAEAFRILRSGGRCGLHELAVHPDTLTADVSARSAPASPVTTSTSAPSHSSRPNPRDGRAGFVWSARPDVNLRPRNKTSHSEWTGPGPPPGAHPHTAPLVTKGLAHLRPPMM